MVAETKNQCLSIRLKENEQHKLHVDLGGVE